MPATAQPCAAAAAGRFVWVSAFGAPYVMRINPRRNVVVGRTTVGSGACGLGVGAGSLWIEDTYLRHREPRLRAQRKADRGDRGRLRRPWDATFAYGAAWATGAWRRSARPDRPGDEPRGGQRVPLGIRRRGGRRAPSARSGRRGGRRGRGQNRPEGRTPSSLGLRCRWAAWTAAGEGAVWIKTRADQLAGSTRRRSAVSATIGDPRRDPRRPRRRGVAQCLGAAASARDRDRDRRAPSSNAVVASGSKGGVGPFVVTEIRGEAWVPSWRGSDVRRFRP